MVLGKRTRNSLASSSSSSATASSQSSSKSTISSPASSVPASPAPSLKRARTRFSESVVPEDEFNNKENVAPLNWFVCGRTADQDGTTSPNAMDQDEEQETDDEAPPPTAARLPTRITRSGGRAGPSHPIPRTASAPTRLSRTRSAPSTSLAALGTPPTTPGRKSRVLSFDLQTPSLPLSKLTITPIDNDDSQAMDIDLESPLLSPTKERSVYTRARTLLRCNNTTATSPTSESSPTVITARETERGTIREYILAGNFLKKGPSKEAPLSSLYVSGSPGTGKTALITDILNKLAQEAHDFDASTVYVNCMGITDVKAVWARVREELVQNLGGSTGSKLKAGDGKRFFEDALKRDQGLRCILVLDELDFISRSPSALSEIYQLAHKYPDTLRLIGISNTLTLGSETSSHTPSTPTKLSRSASSSTVIGYCGPQKSLNFSAYTAPDLQAIITARLASLDQQERMEAFNPTAITFLCKKVAATNGDVRFALSVLRRCVDSAEKEVADAKDGKKGRVEMKHVLESLRAHESGSASASGSASKGSGISRTVRGLGLHARLVLVCLLIGWKRLEAGLPLSAQQTGLRGKSTTSTMTATSLHAFYVALLTANIINDRGEAATSTPFNPISRSEFQDITGVLETSGLISFTSTPPTINGGAGHRSFSAPSLSFLPLSPPKTPTKPRASFALSRTVSSSGGGRKKVNNGEPCVILSEGVREDEVVRGLFCAVVGVDVAEKGNGILEQEVERLWERELRRVTKDVEKRDRKQLEANEKAAMDALAFDD